MSQESREKLARNFRKGSRKRGVFCSSPQMSANESKRKSAKERKRALPRKHCKRPGLKQPGMGTPSNFFFVFRDFSACAPLCCKWGKKNPINIKNFGGTPPGVRPVCPGDTSHLSHDMSRLSRGQSVPLVIDLHINQSQMSQVSLGRPEFVPGTPPGHPTAKFLYFDFSLSVFFSP